MYIKIIYRKKSFLTLGVKVSPLTKQHYFLVMFVVGLLNEDRIVVDTLEVHDLLVESTVESSPI